MKRKEIPKKQFKLGTFLLNKLMLIVALVFEVAALLIKKGILDGSAELVSRLTIAGAVLLLIWLVMDGLSSKYRYYSKKWGIGQNTDSSDK